GAHEGHAHTATLSGFKSQSLDASQAGSGGHNQLVLDDTPGQGSTLVHTTQSQTWLQMGHLLQQSDNLVRADPNMSHCADPILSQGW
uniref:type VI secretion system Vgr family protein n=1 Tax=Aquabacterium sp. TaxID=1872578 RepID=UPI0027BA3D9C